LCVKLISQLSIYLCLSAVMCPTRD